MFSGQVPLSYVGFTLLIAQQLKCADGISLQILGEKIYDQWLCKCHMAIRNNSNYAYVIIIS